MMKHAAGAISCLFVLITFASCRTYERRAEPKNRFPINVISGRVTMMVTGYQERINAIPEVIAADPKYEEFNEQIRRHNKEMDPITMTDTVNEVVEKEAGESYFYSLDRDEVVTVNIYSLGDEAIIECTHKRYTLRGENSGMVLFFRY